MKKKHRSCTKAYVLHYIQYNINYVNFLIFSMLFTSNKLIKNNSQIHWCFVSISNEICIAFDVIFDILCFNSYGLLGASGCGKTTLLSCIVGQKKLHEGQISVLGKCMTTQSATTLGPRIGYMPQVFISNSHITNSCGNFN